MRTILKTFSSPAGASRSKRFSMARLGTHHGGAWKVAYADFVTAMMALFMVLWLTAQDSKDLEEMAKVFKDPFNTPMDKSAGILEGEGSAGEQSMGKERGRAKISDMKVLMNMAQAFMKLLNVDSSDPEKSIDLEVTSDGLRVTLYDRDANPFFVDNTAEYTEWGEFVVETMSWLVHRHRFKVRVDGYVSEGFKSQGPDYTVWELSSDRANVTRRLMEIYGVDGEQFEGVSSYGDSQPLPFIHPTAEANDRVSISLVLSETFNTLGFEENFDSLVK
jgi:chemotaxis protein MotB